MDMCRVDNADALLPTNLSVAASFGTMACACADCSFAPSATKSFCMSTTIMTVVLGSMLSMR